MTASSPHSALSKRDLIWGLAAQGMNIGFMVIMLPVILRYMSRAELGVWFVFAAMIGLVQLLQLGFQYVLARSFSYVYAGAQELLPSGLQDNTGPFSQKLLAELIGAARRIYLTIATLAAVILWTFGTIYLYYVKPHELSFGVVFWAWMAFSASFLINFFYGYLDAVLQGRGDMRLSNKVAVTAKSTQVFFCTLFVAVFHMGLIGLGVGSLLYTIVNRFLALRYAYAPNRPEMRSLSAASEDVGRTVRVLWHNASRYGAALIGAFLISRANILVAAGQIGVVETAGYSLALQLLIVLQQVSALPLNLSLPRLSHLRMVGDKGAVYRVFGLALAADMMIFGVGAIALLFGNPVLRMLGSSTMLPGPMLLVPMVLIFLLELNHGNCANLIAAGNEVPFARAGLVTGICILVLGWLAAPHFGITGLIAVVGVCQLAYNNWKWPLEAARGLQVSYLKLLRDGFASAFQLVVFPVLGLAKR